MVQLLKCMVDIVKFYFLINKRMLLKSLRDINQTLYHNAFQAQFMSSIISPCVSLVTYMIIGTIGFIGSLSVLNGTLLVGELQAFVRYIWQVNDPVSQVSNLSSQIQAAFAALHRISDILNESEEKPVENPQVLTNAKGHVEFEHLMFWLS